jgi:23S rRNA (cytidine1920-2'-O)/16S rRNA (cytidine1409-2'-O)-methyltransferase
MTAILIYAPSLSTSWKERNNHGGTENTEFILVLYIFVVMKKRIDQLLVARGLVESRETAQRLILAGKVLVGTTPVTKASQSAEENAEIHVLEGLKYASRGGLKLEKALEMFEVHVGNKVLLDVGASTGGFADCLLQHGAKKIYAVDVGYGQLSWKLQQDPRLVIMDRTNARFLTRETFSDQIDLAVVDVSFISVHMILQPLLAITGEVILLLKPQFEAGKKDVPKGGVIRNSELHRRILLHFFDTVKAWRIFGLIDSPIKGGSGNREFLVHLKSGSGEGWSKDSYLNRIEELIH